MHVHRRQFRCDAQPVDPRLLGGLAQRRGGDVGVVLVAVAAQLHPAAHAGCSVSSTRLPEWSSTSADAVTWPGTHSRRHASVRACTNANTACRNESWAGSGVPSWTASRSPTPARSSRPPPFPPIPQQHPGRTAVGHHPGLQSQAVDQHAAVDDVERLLDLVGLQQQIHIAGEPGIGVCRRGMGSRSASRGSSSSTPPP